MEEMEGWLVMKSCVQWTHFYNKKKSSASRIRTTTAMDMGGSRPREADAAEFQIRGVP